MEKMRRARINDSLNELKSLVLEAMKKDVSIRKGVLKKVNICLIAGFLIFFFFFLTGLQVFQNGKGRYSGNDCKIPTFTEYGKTLAY